MERKILCYKRNLPFHRTKSWNGSEMLIKSRNEDEQFDNKKQIQESAIRLFLHEVTIPAFFYVKKTELANWRRKPQVVRFSADQS